MARDVAVVFVHGIRGGDIYFAKAMKRALLAELDRPNIGQISDPDLMTSAAAHRAVFENNAERLARERQERKRREAAKVAMEGTTAEKSMEAGAGTEAKPASEPPPVPLPQQIFFKEAKARLDAAVNAEIGFAERLVWFWSNHFCVSANSTVMAGGYERQCARTCWDGSPTCCRRPRATQRC